MSFFPQIIPFLAYLLTLATALFLVLRRPKKVKFEFGVDEDAAEKTRKKLAEVQNALDWYVERDNHLLDRIEMLQRHKAEIVHHWEVLFRTAKWIQDDRDAAEAQVAQLSRVLQETGKLGSARLAQLWKAETKVKELTKRIEQFQTQMAGITTAALGGTKEPAPRGTYGWSVPYQDVLNLRLRYDAALDRIDRTQ